MELIEIKIKEFLLTERRLTTNELFMLSYIDYYVERDGICKCSNYDFANFLGVSERQAIRYLHHLRDLSYLEIEQKGGNRKIKMGIAYAIKRGTYQKGGN